MIDSGYTSVADTYRTNRTHLYSSGQKRRSSDEEQLSKVEMIRWGRLIICAVIFIALVFTKVNMPERFSALRTFFASQMEHSIDYRTVFGAIGRGISGQETVQQTMNHVYMGVFGREAEEGRVLETANVMRPIDFGQQEPVNALLSFSKHWNDCGTWLYDERKREEEQKMLLTEKEVPETDNTLSKETKEKPLVEENAKNMQTEAENLQEGVCMEQRILDLDYVTPVKGWLSSPFGYREHPVEGNEKFHRGLDIAAPSGTEIVSFADGMVKAVGESSSLGKYVMVSHANDLTTIYAHCSKITISSGARVSKGDKIAEVGSTGMVTGAHLHFAIQQGETYLNPIYYVVLEEKK